MLPNFLVLLGASVIPMAVGFAWFHPKTFGGDTWYDVARLTGTDRSEVSTYKLLSTMVLNFFIAFGLFGLTVHQFGIFSLVGGDENLLTTGTAAAFMAEHGNNYLTFGHGVTHAVLQAVIGFAIPLLGYVTIFEKKSFKYFIIYLGYWIINLTLMGGVICAWGASPV